MCVWVSVDIMPWQLQLPEQYIKLLSEATRTAQIVAQIVRALHCVYVT